MEKHEKILRSYKRNHKGAEAGEAERSKIARDANRVQKLGRQAERLLSEAASSGRDDVIDELDSVMLKSKKTAGNLSTHKKRLKQLEKNDDFY